MTKWFVSTGRKFASSDGDSITMINVDHVRMVENDSGGNWYALVENEENKLVWYMVEANASGEPFIFKEDSLFGK